MVDEQQGMRHQEAVKLAALVARNCTSAAYVEVTLELQKEIKRKALLKKKGGISDTAHKLAKIKGKFIKTNPLASKKRPNKQKKSIGGKELYPGYNEDAFTSTVANPEIEHVQWRPKR
jgi:hypothetical protein